MKEGGRADFRDMFKKEKLDQHAATWRTNGFRLVSGCGG
jgi:hypothetical protein